MRRMRKKKNPAAIALGSLGGKARAKKRSNEELSKWGKKAAATRWKKARKKC
jgi:hypothetical protein